MWTDSYETWWTCLVCYMKEMIQCWWRSMSGTRPDNIFKWFFDIERLGWTILHDISKSCWRIRMKLSGQNGCVSWTNCFDFGDDLSPHPTTRIFEVILHHWEIGPKTMCGMISQEVVDGFGWNLVDSVKWWPSKKALILVKIRICIRFLEFFKVILHHSEFGPNRYISGYFKKLGTNMDET